MEIITDSFLKPTLKFYNGRTSKRSCVIYEGTKYMLRVPTSQEIEDPRFLTVGQANIVYNEIAKLVVGKKTENVKEVRFGDNAIITSMCRDFEFDTTGRFYTLSQILGSTCGKAGCRTSLDKLVAFIEDFTQRTGDERLAFSFIYSMLIDYLTLNKYRSLDGMGVLVLHNAFIQEAPIFGGAQSFCARLNKSSVRTLVREGQIKHRILSADNVYLSESVFIRSELFIRLLRRNLTMDTFDQLTKDNIYRKLDSYLWLDHFSIEFIAEVVTTAVEAITNKIYL